MTYKLPFKLKITSVRREPDGIEIDCIVYDANETSVLRKSLTVGPQQTGASISAIMQNEVNVLAAGMFKRGQAVIEKGSEERHAAELNALVHMEFIGSVAT